MRPDSLGSPKRLFQLGLVLSSLAAVLTFAALVYILGFDHSPTSAVADVDPLSEGEVVEDAPKQQEPAQSSPVADDRATSPPVEEEKPSQNADSVEEEEPEPEPPTVDESAADPVQPEEERLAYQPRRFQGSEARGAPAYLSIPRLQLYDVPIFDGLEYLGQGGAHVPGTSWPWDSEAEKNTYIAGHVIGYRDEPSRLLFYRLNELESGDDVVLKDGRGRAYDYQVSEVFEAPPTATQLAGVFRGRDLLTLQTCTLPDFSDRLIVRADRV